MSMNCARCHNHKKDPILAKDYYSMLAFIQDVSDMSNEMTIDINTPEQQVEWDRAQAAAKAGTPGVSVYGIPCRSSRRICSATAL